MRTIKWTHDIIFFPISNFNVKTTEISYGGIYWVQHNFCSVSIQYKPYFAWIYNLNHLYLVYTSLMRGQHIFQKLWRNLQILSAKRVIWSELHSEGPQFWSGVWTSLLSDVLCWAHAHRYTFLCVRKKHYSNCADNIRLHHTKLVEPLLMVTAQRKCT